MKNLIIVGAEKHSILFKKNGIDRLKRKFGRIIVIRSMAHVVNTALDRCRLYSEKRVLLSVQI